MIEALIAAGASVFVGLLAFFGVVYTNRKSNDKMQNEMITSQALTDEKLKELTREVREHNNFAVHIPVMQEQIKEMQRDIKELKGYHKPQ